MERLSMRKIREVLRLKFEIGLSARQIAVSLQVGRASVGDYLNRFAASGLIWLSALSDADLQRSLFPSPLAVPSEQRPIPDWAKAHAELRRPGVTWPCFGRSTASANHRVQSTSFLWTFLEGTYYVASTVGYRRPWQAQLSMDIERRYVHSVVVCVDLTTHLHCH